MDTLQKMFESALVERSKKAMIDRTIQIVERKVKRRGVSLTKSQKFRLRKLLLSERFSSMALRFRGKPKSFSQPITFTKKDVQQVERYSRSLFSNLQGIIEEVSAPQAHLLLDTLRKSWPSQRARDRGFIKGFERRLIASWKTPLDLLEMHVHIALELGTGFNEQHRQVAKLKKPLLIEVLNRLHARSCQVAAEVLVLLKCGFSDGAMARWRTLHEIAVTSLFIRKHGEKMARRYLCYEAIESYKGAQQYQRYCRRLGHESFSQAEMKEIEDARSGAINEFGKSFGENYGWAASVLKHSNPTFAQIEENIGLNHLRPYYKMASQNVHADPKGAIFRLGLNGERFLLAGPSNMGLVEPGHSTAISLLQVTSCLLFLQSTLDNVVLVKVMMILSDEIGTAFSKAHEKIEAREKKLRPKEEIKTSPETV